MQKTNVTASNSAINARSPVQMKLSEDGKAIAVVVVGDPDNDAAEQLTDLIGLTGADALSAFIRQIADACIKNGGVDFEAANFVLSVVIDAKPQDAFETMLATQMGLVHWHSIQASRTLANAGVIIQYDSARNALTKLTRTYVSQMEALKRYRTGGEQKVTVEHVTVNQGGQAIVGAVAARAGEPKNREPTP